MDVVITIPTCPVCIVLMRIHTNKLGDPYLGILLNHLLLIVKRYIYSCKYTKHNLNFIETINIIKYHRNIEKFILSEKEDMFKNKWENLIL